MKAKGAKIKLERIFPCVYIYRYKLVYCQVLFKHMKHYLYTNLIYNTLSKLKSLKKKERKRCLHNSLNFFISWKLKGWWIHVMIQVTESKELAIFNRRWLIRIINSISHLIPGEQSVIYFYYSGLRNVTLSRRKGIS